MAQHKRALVGDTGQAFATGGKIASITKALTGDRVWNIREVGFSGTVTAVSAIAGDTVTVNGLVYTGVTGAKANNTEFSIDTGDTETAADLADSITNDTRTGITFPSLDVTAVNSTNIVTITATTIGNEEDNIDLASSNGTRLAVSGATLEASATGAIKYKLSAGIDVPHDDLHIPFRIALFVEVVSGTTGEINIMVE